MYQQIARSEMQRIAPSVFQTAPKSTLSTKYAFVPTIKVVDVLESQGWNPVYVAEGRTRSDVNRGFQRHVIRFRHESDIGENTDGIIPEMVMVNSHDGGSSFQLMTGIFRIVCGNGLIAADASFETIKIRHMGFAEDEVIQASQKIMSNIPQIMGKVERFRNIELSSEQRLIFAECAAMVRWAENSPVDGHELLRTRRTKDEPKDLFTTFNVVQENLIRGGIRGADRKRVRAVNSLGENVRLNKALWSMTEKMATLAA